MGCWDENLFKCSWSHNRPKMASRPIYGKTVKHFLLRNQEADQGRPMTLKLGTEHKVLNYYQIRSHVNTGLTMSIFQLLIPQIILFLGKLQDIMQNSENWVLNILSLIHLISSHLSPLTSEVVGATQMTLQQYLSTLPCLPLPSRNLQIPFPFIP